MRHALLLAGGRGKRFWPRSRRARPKQFMPFADGKSLLRITAERLAPSVPYERQWVITNRDYTKTVRRELPEVPRDQIIGEPRGLNTAPAIGLGAELMRAKDPDAVMMVQAADHWIRDRRRFRSLVGETFRQVERRRTVAMIAFPPTRPATGFGYVRRGAPVDARAGFQVNEVLAFKEKPRPATAKRYLASGDYLWNGCMFFWHADTILAGLGRFLPRFAGQLERAGERLARGTAAGRVIADLYRDGESIAIEHAVVERLEESLVVEGDCGWEDIGTWGSLVELLPADADGNVVQGAHHGVDTRNSLVLADRGLVVTLGVRDLIVVKDGDAVLVLPRRREGELRELIEGMERDPELRQRL